MIKLTAFESAAGETKKEQDDLTPEQLKPSREFIFKPIDVQ